MLYKITIYKGKEILVTKNFYDFQMIATYAKRYLDEGYHVLIHSNYEDEASI